MALKRSRNSYPYTEISRQMTCIRTTIKTAVEVGTSTDANTLNTLTDATYIPTYNKDDFIAFLDQEKQNMRDLVHRLKILDNSNIPYLQQLEQLEQSVLLEGRIHLLNANNSLPQRMRVYINMINYYINQFTDRSTNFGNLSIDAKQEIIQLLSNFKKAAIAVNRGLMESAIFPHQLLENFTNPSSRFHTTALKIGSVAEEKGFNAIGSLANSDQDYLNFITEVANLIDTFTRNLENANIAGLPPGSILLLYTYLRVVAPLLVIFEKHLLDKSTEEPTNANARSLYDNLKLLFYKLYYIACLHAVNSDAAPELFGVIASNKSTAIKDILNRLFLGTTITEEITKKDSEFYKLMQQVIIINKLGNLGRTLHQGKELNLFMGTNFVNQNLILHLLTTEQGTRRNKGLSYSMKMAEETEGNDLFFLTALMVNLWCGHIQAKLNVYQREGQYTGLNFSNIIRAASTNIRRLTMARGISTDSLNTEILYIVRPYNTTFILTPASHLINLRLLMNRAQAQEEPLTSKELKRVQTNETEVSAGEPEADLLPHGTNVSNIHDPRAADAEANISLDVTAPGLPDAVITYQDQVMDLTGPQSDLQPTNKMQKKRKPEDHLEDHLEYHLEEPLQKRTTHTKKINTSNTTTTEDTDTGNGGGTRRKRHKRHKKRTTKRHKPHKKHKTKRRKPHKKRTTKRRKSHKKHTTKRRTKHH